MSGKALKWLGAGLGVVMLWTSCASTIAATAPGAVVAHPVDAMRVAATAALVSPYTWSATKAADGSVAFVGYVPSKDVHDSLVDGIGQISSDTTSVADGAPTDFATDALAALQVLSDLDSGAVSFDGAAWSVTGAVDTADKAKIVQQTFDESALKSLGASYKVSGPAAVATPSITTVAPPAASDAAPAPAAPAAAAETPAAAPAAAAATPPAPTAPVATPADYTWSAEKAADGTISFSGAVATPALKSFLAVHAGGKVTDASTVTAGAPKDFVGGSLYGVDALMALDTGKLSLSGGKWSLTGVAKDEAATKAAHAALGAIDTKAWQFDISTAPAPAAAAATPAQAATPALAAAAAAPAEPYLFGASKAGGGPIALTGSVPTEGAKRYFGITLGDVPTDGLKVAPDAPKEFIANALAGLQAIGQLTDGTLAFDGTKWSLHGNAATPDAAASLGAHIAALPSGKDWTTDIVGPSDVEMCRAKLADFVKVPANAINFDSRTHFAKGTEAALDLLAADLKVCPKARVDVAGHTDADGDANANMALSVARAEAVIDALVKRGVAIDRLYAVGYGETLPLVPNTTKANKAKNRRIEFTVVDPAQK
jgi:outer membrane protein OmpA-like peptidoglycan-associated protein